jgi:SAM-dependent methyltransferase
MDHVTTGLYRFLEFPSLYTFLQRVLGGPRATQRHIAESIRPFAGARILDIGCGPATILRYLPSTVHYVGYDFNPRYIEHARKVYQDRGEFIACRVDDAPRLGRLGTFDFVLATAILHHLNDAEASVLIDTAHSHLKTGGKLITLDCVYIPRQPLVAKFLISHDRGRHVRTPEGYVALLKGRFDSIEASIRSDVLRVPYTHFVARCTKTAAAVEEVGHTVVRDPG